MAESTKPIIEEEAPHIEEEGPALPALLSDEFLAKFEKGVENYKRWIQACYKLTKESHWLRRKDRGGNWKYMLQGPGAEALMNPLAINADEPEFKKETSRDEHGDYYRWWCEGIIESKALHRRGLYVGNCDSRDQFFTARPGWNPLSGEGDVKKSAQTNWIVNGVSRLAGIRDPSEETLRAAGLVLDKIPSVDYDGGKTPGESAGKISEAQVKRLWAICKNKNIPEETLKAYMQHNFKITSTNDILRKDYDAIGKWAEAGGKFEAPKQPEPTQQELGGTGGREPGQEG